MQEDSQNVINLEFRQISDLTDYLPQIAFHKTVKRLSLHGNRLKNLPADLSLISHIEYMDLSGNLFKGSIETTMAPLRGLPRLKELVITLNSADEEKQLIRLLPNLEFLNGTRILRDRVRYLSQNNSMQAVNDSSSMRASNPLPANGNKNGPATANGNAQRGETVAQSSLATFGDQPPAFHETIEQAEVEQVLSLYELLSALKEPQKDGAELLSDLHGHLTNILMDIELNSKQLKHPLAREIHLLKARFALIDIVFHNYLKVLTERRDDPFRQHSRVLLQTFYSLLTPIFKGFVDLAIIMEPRTETNFDALREKVRRTVAEPGSALDRSEKLVKHNEEILRAWQAEVKTLHNEIVELREEVKAVEGENKVLLDKLIKHTKEKLEDVQAQAVQREASRSPGPSNQLHNDSVSHRQDVTGLTGGQPQFPGAKGRSVPKKLESLKETIGELAEAKLAADRKNEETVSPRQTLEQFMYSYFKFKFGLKSLVADHAEQLILGIQAFKDYDVGVFIFGKILRNEVDESYLGVHQNLKRTIHDSIRILVQRRSPYLSQAGVAEVVEKLKGGGRLPGEDLRKIAGFILGNNKKDLALFSKLLGGESEVAIHEFEEKLCHYRLMKYEAGLKPFNMVFKKIDESNAGVVSVSQLEELLTIFNKITESKGFMLDVRQAVARLDPHRFDTITYSQIVQYLLSVSVEYNARQLSYIQFLKLITK